MNNTFLGDIVAKLVLAIQPLKEALTDEVKFKKLMNELGWSVTNFPSNTLSSVITSWDDLLDSYNSLSDASTEDEIIDILVKAAKVFIELKNCSSNLGTSLNGVNSSFSSEFPGRLFDYLITDFVKKNYDLAYSILKLINVFQYDYIEPTSSRIGYFKTSVDYSKLSVAVSNPVSLLIDKLSWNSANYSSNTLFYYLLDVFAKANIPANFCSYDATDNLGDALDLVCAFPGYNVDTYIDICLLPIPSNNSYEYLLLRIVNAIPITSTNIADRGFFLQLIIPDNISISQSISSELKLILGAGALINARPTFLVRASGIEYKTLKVGSNVNTKLEVGLQYTPQTPIRIFGKPQGTRLQLLEAGINIEGKHDGNEIEIITEADLSGLEFVINPGDSDGFIKKVFGEGQKKLTLPIIISWSSKHGIRFKGSGAFEITVNPNKPLGPIVFNELTLALKAIENQPLKTQIGATISGKIGPISFIVENIGIELKFDKNEGNAGPFGIDIGFKPPNGVGLKVKASKLEGGGYLYIDRDKGRYAGGIELDIFGKLRVTAVGIITTKNPDGTPGFSLLIAVGVEFPGIPVGFGFTFNGVGVLAGVNRTMNPNALRAGVKGGAINSLMFPKNVIENIKTLITDMESYFPIEQKKYTFGVFFLLKWGVGVPLVSIKLGVIISFPQPVRLAIVGIIQIALPDPNVPVLQLNVAFVGIIDFENKYISFDASIYDSRLLFITLYGDMAVRLFWGERREMLVSVGGFHPAYNAPAYLMLPKMDRMTLSIFDEKNLRLIIETYFAVTSNTVQFGVKLDFLLKVWKLKVLGWFGFDVLFQFNPFKFLSHVYAGLAVMWDDKELLCISLDFNLNGPGPWHAVGKGEFTVLGMKQSANFDETWGDEPDTSAPEIEVTPKLLDALNKDENWQGSLPEGRKTYVKLAVSGTGTLIMDPLGEFTITQKVLPFTINIERFGGQKVKDVGIYSLDLVKVNGVAITSPTSTKENFASAQFKEMNDNDKIKAPSFEFLPNGVKIGYDYSELMFGDFITKDIEYDVVLIDGENRTDINVLNTTIDINSFTKGGLISTNQISKKAKRDIASPIDKVDFNQESYVLVSKDSLNTISTTSIGSLGNAYTERDKIYAKSPELKGMYEIIPA